MLRGDLRMPRTTVEIARHGVPQVRTCQPRGWRESFEHGEPRGRSLPLRDGYRTVQRMHGRWGDGLEHCIEARDLAPPRLGVARCEAMLRGNPRCRVKTREHVPRRGALYPRDAARDPVAIPQRSI